MKKFEKKIENWAQKSVPDVFEKVLEQKGMPAVHKAPRSRRLGRLVPLLIVPIIAVLALLLSPAETIEASSVYLDFDTAIEIQVDADNRIVELRGDNDSGLAFVDVLKANSNWENAELDTYLQVLFETAHAQGFIAANTPVLVGAMAETMSRRDTLQSSVIDRMQNLPAQARPFGDIYDSQYETTLPEDSQETHGRMSMMRIALIEKIEQADASLTSSELSSLSVSELIAVAQSLGVELSPRPGMRP